MRERFGHTSPFAFRDIVHIVQDVKLYHQRNWMEDEWREGKKGMEESDFFFRWSYANTFSKLECLWVIVTCPNPRTKPCPGCILGPLTEHTTALKMFDQEKEMTWNNASSTLLRDEIVKYKIVKLMYSRTWKEWKAAIYLHTGKKTICVMIEESHGHIYIYMYVYLLIVQSLCAPCLPKRVCTRQRNVLALTGCIWKHPRQRRELQ